MTYFRRAAASPRELEASIREIRWSNIVPAESLADQALKKHYQIDGTSLVAQWLRILLPMQGTWVRIGRASCRERV